jgi:hypothetical protein
LTLSAVIALRAGWATVRTLRERRAERRRQRMLVTFAARAATDRAAVVVDHAHPAAYCLSGRRPIVVVTRGALNLLTAPSWTRYSPMNMHTSRPDTIADSPQPPLPVRRCPNFRCCVG